MERSTHPYQSDFETCTGVNIELNWPNRAVCRTVEEPERVFFPGRGERNLDKEVCATCPVRISCLMDAMAKGKWQTQGRRAGTTPTNRDWMHSNIQKVLGSMRSANAREAYYANNPSAPIMVREYKRYNDQTYPRAEEWPTKAAVNIHIESKGRLF